jgi:hypothetical protein
LRAKIKARHDELKAGKKKKGSHSKGQGETEAAINSIRFKLEETIINRVEDVLVFVDQRTQDLQKKFNVNTEKKKHLGLPAVTRTHGRASTKSSTSGSKKSWMRST